MSRKLLGIGAAALVAGALMFGLSQTGSGNGTAYAGSDEDECVTFTPTRTNTRTSTPVPATNTSTPIPPTSTPTDVPIGQINAFGNETAQATCVATNTATRTPTRTTTGTAVPSTSTPVPATNTPTGGSGGQVVRPPSTGFGDTGSDGSSTWFLLAGAALVALGGGAIFAGAKKRS